MNLIYQPIEIFTLCIETSVLGKVAVDCISLSLYLSLSIHLSLSLYLSLSIHLSLSFSLSLSIHLSLSFSLSLSLSLYKSIQGLKLFITSTPARFLGNIPRRWGRVEIRRVRPPNPGQRQWRWWPRRLQTRQRPRSVTAGRSGSGANVIKHLWNRFAANLNVLLKFEWQFFVFPFLESNV